MRHSGSVL